LIVLYIVTADDLNIHNTTTFDEGIQW